MVPFVNVIVVPESGGATLEWNPEIIPRWHQDAALHVGDVLISTLYAELDELRTVA